MIFNCRGDIPNIRLSYEYHPSPECDDDVIKIFIIGAICLSTSSSSKDGVIFPNIRYVLTSPRCFIELQCYPIFLQGVIFQTSGDLPNITLPEYDDDVTRTFIYQGDIFYLGDVSKIFEHLKGACSRGRRRDFGYRHDQRVFF